MAMQPFQKKVWLSTPTMHGEEQKWVDEAIRTNWVSTVGANINEVERLVRIYAGLKTIMIERDTHCPMPQFRAMLEGTIY